MGEVIVLQRPEQGAEAAATFSVVGNLALQPEFIAPEPKETPVTEEKYAHSLRTIRALGSFVAKETIETPEGAATQDMLRTDFDTALAEMLNTDPELRDLLDISPSNDYRIVDDKIVMKNGKPIADMIHDGVEASTQAAKKDPRMKTQAVRDGVEEMIIERVDELRPGQMLVGVSMDPKEAMDRDGEAFWHDGFGYRRGLAFIPWYYKVDETTLCAGSFSVGHSDKATWSTMLSRYGMNITPDTSSDEWLANTFTANVQSREEAKQFIENMRSEYYKERGVERTRLSVTDLLKRQYKQFTDAVFTDLYKPFAEASFKHQKNQTMHELAASYLENSSHLGAKMRQRLMKIVNTTRFDDEASRTMEFMIRYGTVVKMREHLKQAFAPQSEQAGVPNTMPVTDFQLMQQLAIHANAGAQAGLKFGGCAAGIILGEAQRATEGRSGDPINPQDIFGGKVGNNGDEDEFKIPDKIRCIKCNEKSPKEEVIHEGKTKDSGYWCCPKCKYAVDVCTGKEVDEHGNPLRA
ncbi:MAG TPA: hypothetical protein VJR27_05275 [Candidatus Saccharimonadales bacterium]|nr:hypothetical protein [Candidatus Saccharimonadales bacterium]